jgi:nucleoid DNA-binding protein
MDVHMTQSELVQEIAKQTGVSKKATLLVLKAMGEKVVGATMAGESVTLPGFGVFYSVKLKPKELFGEGKKSALRRKVRFRQRRRK